MIMQTLDTSVLSYNLCPSLPLHSYQLKNLKHVLMQFKISLEQMKQMDTILKGSPYIVLNYLRLLSLLY
jgi:hypothetical protein